MQRSLALAWIAWLGVFAAGVALSFAARHAGPLAEDRPLTDALQSLPEVIEPAARLVRAVTQTRVVLVVGGLAVMALWWRGARVEAAMLALLLLALPFAQALLKDLVDRPRPSPQLVEQRTGYTSESFPAGHVMSGTVVYGYLSVVLLVRERRLPRGVAVVTTGLLVALLLANLVANIYMGVHWPTDVLGGVLWAVVLLIPALVTLVVFSRHTRGQ